MANQSDFSQFEQFAKNWQKMESGFADFLKGFLLEMALRVIAKVKPRTPVDTGALRAMWGVGSQNIVTKESTGGKISVDVSATDVAVIDMVGSNFEITIWNGMSYASFLEYGHRTPSGGWVEGYFMFTISIDEVQRQMPLRFQKAFKEFLNSYGVG